MRTQRHYRQGSDTFEDVFKHLVDTKLDDFIKEKTKQQRAGNGIHEL
ncbi:hypothetical protein [Alteribacter natronophilus]|nr:hypothetical protein [Alteribacter natronophilus]